MNIMHLVGVWVGAVFFLLNLRVYIFGKRFQGSYIFKLHRVKIIGRM